MMPLAVLIVTTMLPAAGASQDPSALFAEGIALYQQGDFEEALARFQNAEDSGGDPGVLAYNRGNCLFRLGRHGPALYEFLKAERHRPRDGRVARNIAVTASRLGIAATSGSGFANLFRRAAGTFRADEYRTAGALLAALFFIVAAVAFRRGRDQALKWAFLLLLPGLLLYALSAAVADGPRGHTAVVVERAAQVFNEPAESSDALFSLREGEIVIVHETRGRWLRVSDSEGHSGWARGGEVREVSGESADSRN
jgi:tetratricopeptide (TPR) repeat protein